MCVRLDFTEGLGHRLRAYHAEEVLVFATGADGFPRDLGAFLIQGIEPASRATPRIRVVLRIDDTGAVRIAARDLGTGRTNSAQLGRVEISRT